MLVRTILAPISAVAASSALAVAQGPSVLDLSSSYHVGLYSASVGVPSGAVRLLMECGEFVFQPNQTMTGTLSSWEWTSTSGTTTVNSPLAADYHVSPDAVLELDFDPQNPGSDLLELLIDPDASVLHMARYDLDPESITLLAVEKSTGLGTTSLSGTYRFYSQYLYFSLGNLETADNVGTATFDGVGNASMVFSETSWDRFGQSSTASRLVTLPYSVANDGALTVGGGVPAGGKGAMSSNGDLIFIMWSGGAEVGMSIGVREGANYDLTALAGRFSLHGQGHALGETTGPRNVTDLGEFVVSAATPTTGSFTADGVTVDGNRTGQWLGALQAAGPAALGNNGVVTFGAGPGSIELAFADTGRVAVGRVDELYSNMFFAVRACDECRSYGSGTPGAGGLEPELGMRSFPTLGNANWRFAVTEGLGGAGAILAVGFADSPGVPLFGSTNLLWLNPLQIVASNFLLLGGASGVAGAGSADVPIAIPADPSYAGVTLFGQALVLDPAAPNGVAMSAGFRTVFCK